MARRQSVEVEPEATSPTTPELDMHSSSSKQSSSVLFFILGGMVMLILLLILFFIFKKLIKTGRLKMFIARPMKCSSGATNVLSGNLHTIRYFDFETLKKATKNFHHIYLVGRGGFGPVFLRKLEDGKLIAVKQLSLDKSQQGESEFLSEVFSELFTAIVTQTASFSIQYATNLPQILMQHLGYTAPEYAIRGELSEKADIFSFGVLLLEIISCRKNTDLTLPSEKQYLPEYLYEKSKLIDLVDPKLRKDGIVEKDILQVLHITFLCLQPHANLRPPMSKIVAMLTCKVELDETPVRPAFLDRKQRINEPLSWDTISEVFPSPQTSDPTSFPRPAISSRIQSDSSTTLSTLASK